AAVLSARLLDVLDRVPPVGAPPARLPPRQRAAARDERDRPLAAPGTARGAGAMARRGRVRAPSPPRRIGRVGAPAEERAARSVLPARVLRLRALRARGPATALGVVRRRRRALRRGAAREDRDRVAAGGRGPRRLVEARPPRLARRGGARAARRPRRR